MLRPSPTTIDLAANDITNHLQRLDIYRGLLQQGFKKGDIQRYFREQREAANDGTKYLLSPTSLRAPTWVDLANRHSNVDSKLESRRIRGIQTMSSTEISTSDASSSAAEHIGNEFKRSPPDCMAMPTSYDGHKNPKTSNFMQLSTASNLVGSVDELSVNSRTKEAMSDPLNKPCIPRRTSLLRYSSKLPSDEQVDVQQPLFSSVSLHSQIRYRLRTDTYSYEQSDIGDDKSECSSLITEFGDLILDNSLVSTKTQSSRLRGDAKEFTLQDPHSVPSTAEMLPGNSIKPNDSLSEGARLASPVDTSRMVPTLALHKGKRQGPVVDFSSSPPLPTASNFAVVGSVQASSPTLPPMPLTPQDRHTVQDTRTDPYQARFRYLDGTSFTPYNDSIPASRQPQTPADLARTPMISELSAAYTAPPGRLRNDATTPQLDQRNNLGSGQESPTNRAISMRQRRNREFARSARVEGLRIHRMRRHHQVDASWETEEQLNLWRDDLDADRVGEENFDDTEGLPDNTGIGIRVVSGNRHANAI